MDNNLLVLLVWLFIALSASVMVLIGLEGLSNAISSDDELRRDLEGKLELRRRRQQERIMFRRFDVTRY